MTDSRIEFLTELETIIANRAAADVAESYTAELVAAGAKRVAQKVVKISRMLRNQGCYMSLLRPY